jgi:hypothetical protein
VPPTPRQLADLLIDPHETLDIELKDWLDITGNNDHKATLAKALIALANHGGGFVIFGFVDTGGHIATVANRPPDLSAYTPDTINSVVRAYAEPLFHCDVTIVAAPDGSQYPIISVPGGHHVPIKARRDGPNGQIVKQNSYYIRRPGPQSEIPQTAAEWDTLLRRCISNSRDDLVDQIRAILSGGTASATPEGDLEIVERWFAESLARWGQIITDLPPQHSARFPKGHWALAYRLAGNLKRLSAKELLDAVSQNRVRHTGWPAFWVPTRAELRPYMRDDNLECWMGRDGADHGAAHSDFWRVAPDGKFFIIRGYQEDEPRDTSVEPGTRFDITIPAWRMGEVFLHSSNMAVALGDPAAQVTILTEWTGLTGRSLTNLERRRIVFDEHRSQQPVYRRHLTVQADQINNMLPELVTQVIVPLYELFDFFRLPANLPAEELARMRANRF